MNHKWIDAGHDHNGIPNIWRCDRCGIHRSEGRVRSNKTAGRLAVEYTDAEGAVISVTWDGSPVPACAAEGGRLVG